MVEEEAGQVPAIHCPQCNTLVAAHARFCNSCDCSTSRASRTTEIIDARNTHDEDRARQSLIGRILDSKYELLAILGTGGLGTVYRARRVHIGDEVAVKVLNSNCVLDQASAERFRREARSAAMIRHPNVVTIHDFSESKGDAPAYIVMELVPGTSLRDILNHEKRLAPDRAVAFMRDICAGVGVAHRRGVVHRDLKPDNVIIQAADFDGEREVAKVVDFGIAKAVRSNMELTLTQTGAMVGTPFYMSPEQFRGQQLDARSDVYSLGAMLYEMLAGTPPFSADSLPELISKQLTEEPPDFSPPLNIPAGLQRVCREALAKQPQQRPADATLFAQQLERAVAEPEPVTSSFEPTPLAQSATAETLPSAQPKPGLRALKWTLAGGFVVLFLALVAIATIVVERSLVANRSRSVNRELTNSQSSDNTNSGGASTVDNSDSSPLQDPVEMAGKWSGTYGPSNTPATLTVNDYRNGKFSGVIEQGGMRVAFTGNLDTHSRQVTIKETSVLSGSGWSLGEDTGQISADGRTMSGTGSDATGRLLGLTYQWSFSK